MHKTLEDIKSDYIGQDVDVDSSCCENEFRGSVVDVKLDTDNTILISVVDQDDNVFDIPIEDIKYVYSSCGMRR